MLNTIEVRSYDKVIGYAGRCRKPMIDYITEYSLVAPVSYTVEQFENLLAEAHKTVCELVKYTKRKLTYKSGRVEYLHICECREY